MRIVGYEFLLLGVVSIFLQQKWIFRIRKYVMMSCLTLGMFLMTIGYTEYKNESEHGLFWYCLFLTVSLIIGFIAIIIKQIKNKFPVEVMLEIPAGTYDIIVEDNPTRPDVQIKYVLKYIEQLYVLCSTPPKGKPGLTLYAVKDPKTGIFTGSIVVDKSEQKITIIRVLKTLRKLLVFIAAAMMPIFFVLWDSGIMKYNYFDNCMVLVGGFCFSAVTEESKFSLHLFVYCFGRFFEILGWIIMFIEPFLPPV